MSIENILKRIEEETEDAIKEILGAAGAHGSVIREDYAKKGAKLREELERKVRMKAADEERRLIIGEELELRKAFLKRKCEILNEVYGDVRRRIESRPAAEYLEILKRLIIAHSLSGREEIVVPAEQRGMFTGAYIDSLNEARGEGAAFTLAEAPGDFSWGVVLHEGHRRVDLTLGVVFEQLKARIEPEIASFLFPE